MPISSLKNHPKNPRRGNVAAIAESLQVSGQFKPILVQVSTRYVLAGNHTMKAARSLGWSNISVNWIDCDDEQAVQILLADNKASDAGRLNDDAVFALASSLPDLKGTGYVAEDLRIPDIDLSAYDPDPEKDPADEPAPAPDAGNPPAVALRLGSWKGAVDPDHFNEWRAGLPKRNSEALAEVLVLLGLVVPDVYAEEGSGAAESGRVPLSELKPYPGNPNEGDIGLIATLLVKHGQTRPIIVSKRTNHILAGNHVARAAESLGWTHIGVSWVDTDSDGEKRIVLADNRTAQLSSYDMQDLGNLIASVGASRIEGTGYTLADLDDIILGRSPHLNGYYTRSEMIFRIGALQTKVKTALVQDLNLTHGQELAEIAAIIGLDPQKVAQEQ